MPAQEARLSMYSTREPHGTMHTPGKGGGGGGGGKGNFAFRFLRAKKKGVPRMLFTRGLAHSQVYEEREKEGLPFEPFDQSGRMEERHRGHLAPSPPPPPPDISTIEISNEYVVRRLRRAIAPPRHRSLASTRSPRYLSPIIKIA